MGKKLSSTLSAAARGAAGMAAGAAFATAISGATELNELAGEYQVQTGANAQEAKAFATSLNDIFKNAHQGYDEIAQTLIGLKTHFDMDGEAAKTLAANVLDFAEIAGGTGADAVERLNSLVKTGVIAQADMSATLDKVTLAHQRWGININETLDSLTKFAPAMNALGMSTDDAIAWMSIFNKAGVDAQRVTMGFNTAIKQVKTPEEFKQLVAQIAATPDDFTRAKLASDLFGQRAGAALANMLRPGSEGVAEMAQIIGTDYTGAVAKAAEVNDNTFGGQALLMLHKFQGTLAELGTNMGDLLIVFAMLGPSLTKGLMAGIGGIAGILAPRLLAALAGILPFAITSGTAQGTAMGAAAATAAVATETTGVVAGQATLGLEAAPAAAAAGTTIGTALGSAAGAAMALVLPAAVLAALAGIPLAMFYLIPSLFDHSKATQAMDTAAGRLDEHMVDQFNGLIPGWQARAEAAGATIADGIGTGAVDAARRDMDKEIGGLGPALAGAVEGSRQDVAVAGQHVGSAAAKAVSAEIHAGRDDIKTAWDATLAQAMRGGLGQAGINALKATGIAMPEAIAQGITEARQKPVDAFDTLRTMMKNSMSVTAEIARLSGQLTSSELAKGLRDRDPAVRAQAQAVKDSIIARLKELGPNSKTWGAEGARLLAAGLKSKDPDIRAAALALKGIVDEGLKKMPPAGTAAGASTANAVPPAINNEQTRAAVHRAAVLLANEANVSVVGTGSTITITYKSAYSRARAEGGPVMAGQPYWVGERGPEQFIPATNGTIVPHGAVAGGGLTVNGGIHLSGIGSDVGPGAARRFGQAVLDEVAKGLQEQGARRGIFAAVRP